MADTSRAARKSAHTDSDTMTQGARSRRKIAIGVLFGAAVGVAAALLSDAGMSRERPRPVRASAVATASAPAIDLITDSRALAPQSANGSIELATARMEDRSANEPARAAEPGVIRVGPLDGDVAVRQAGSSLNYGANRLSRTSRGAPGAGWQHTPGDGVPAFTAHMAVGVNGNGGVIRPGELSRHGATPNAASGFESRPFGDRRVAGPGQIDAREAARRARAQVDQWGRQYCYRRALLDDPRLEGRLDVELSVNATGRVERVTAAAAMNSSLQPAQEFRRCVERNLGGYSLGQPIGGPTQFAMTLNLSPGQRL